MYTDTVGKLLFRHHPEVVGKADVRSPPQAGDLAPHPRGAAWSQNLLDLFRIMSDNEEITNIPTFYYYPLLARHCSDVNMEGTQDGY